MNISNFLTTSLGKSITFLTRAAYYDLPYPKEIVVKKYHSKINHVDVMIFEFEEHNIIIFQGTSCIIDWIADFKMAIGIKPRQFKSALKFVRANFDPEKPTFIAGHSLGGAITQYVVHELNSENVQGITYNGAGTRHLLKERDNYKIFNFIANRDILNRITMRMPFSYFKHVGETLTVNDTLSKNGFESHCNFEVFLD